MSETISDLNKRMLELTRSFPSLHHVLIVWVPRFLDEWAAGPEAKPQARLAGQFVLSVVYDRKARWSCGRFDLHKAMAAWDGPHRQAFASWAQNPWYPAQVTHLSQAAQELLQVVRSVPEQSVNRTTLRDLTDWPTHHLEATLRELVKRGQLEPANTPWYAYRLGPGALTCELQQGVLR